MVPVSLMVGIRNGGAPEPGTAERWFDKQVRISQYSPGRWMASFGMGSISVSGTGGNVWDAIRDALESYGNWLSFYRAGSTQGAAEQIWGTTSHRGRTSREAGDEGRQKEENDEGTSHS